MGYPETAAIWDIYEYHLDEGEFLWERWEQAFGSALQHWSSLTVLEERLLAHLDGLALGGAPIRERLLQPALASEGARASAAALALLMDATPASLQALEEALRDGTPAHCSSIGRALEVSDSRIFEERLLALIHAKDLAIHVRSAALRALAHQGVPAGAWLESFLLHDSPAARVAACLVARVSPPGLSSPHLPRLWLSDIPDVRDAAIETGLTFGLRKAWQRCKQVVEDAEQEPDRCIWLLAVGAENRDRELLRKLLHHPALRPSAIEAMGYGGHGAHVEMCLELLLEPAVSRLATEAFCSMTGFALSEEALLEEEPVNDEPTGAPLLPDSEATLPRLRPDMARAWWSRERKRFDPDQRYLMGAPLAMETLLPAFTHVPARRWHGLARELAIRSAGRCCLMLPAFTTRRARRLSTLQGRALRLQSPFAAGLHS